jgi:pyruvate-formate lyase-activating enzyme
MKHDLLDLIANPEELSELPTFAPLARIVVNQGSVRLGDGGGPIVETPARAWDYGASIELDHAAVPPGRSILLAVSAFVSRGKVGVLVADGPKVFRELWWTEDEGRMLKFLQLPPLTPGAVLIFRSAEEDLASEIHIDWVQAFVGFDGVFKQRPDYDLQTVTRGDFKPKAQRSPDFTFGSVTTTESCDLSCVMCHFNGPKAVKKARTLTRDQVAKVLAQAPAGDEIWLAATGEFFMDPNAMEHLAEAARLGHRIAVLTHGQLLTPERMDRMLEIGVRKVRISADSIYPAQYRKIRRGGELEKILDAFDYLRAKKTDYPGLSLEASCTLLSNTYPLQKEFEAFWRDKVDRLFFNVEYFDQWRFRKTFSQPPRRVNCEIATYVVPSGHIAPCCAVMVHAHDGDTSWLPHVDTHTLKEAYDELCDLYDDPQSPLAKLCADCDWWIMWAQNDNENGTAYCRWVDFTER